MFEIVFGRARPKQVIFGAEYRNLGIFSENSLSSKSGHGPLCMMGRCDDCWMRYYFSKKIISVTDVWKGRNGSCQILGEACLLYVFCSAHQRWNTWISVSTTYIKLKYCMYNTKVSIPDYREDLTWRAKPFFGAFFWLQLVLVKHETAGAITVSGNHPVSEPNTYDRYLCVCIYIYIYIYIHTRGTAFWNESTH